MTAEELLKNKGITLALFDGDLWHRPGFYIEELRTMFINTATTKAERQEIIYHELGHDGHSPYYYSLHTLRCENEAERFMIHNLIEEELKEYDIYSFNSNDFAERHNLNKPWHETMIKDEFGKIASGL